MVAAKPDITGEKFGYLTVIGRGKVIERWGGKKCRTWKLRCICEKIIELPRGEFARSKHPQKSCGCMSHIGGRRPKDITGQKFGSLTAIQLTGKKDTQGKPTWLMQCDCKDERFVEMSLSRLGRGYRLNCGDLSHEPGLRYPPTPTPYPEYAAAIVAKYLYLTQPKAPKFDSRVQDERMDRLLRAAWILEYRVRWGENFTPEGERRFICKHLRYAEAQVKLKRFVEAGGVSRYTFNRYKRKGIGGVMTDLTSSSKAASTQGKTQPEVVMPKRRIKFKRC